MITMIRAAAVLWILSAVICVGRGAHDPCHVQNTTVDHFNNGLAMVLSANKGFAFRLYRKLSGLSDSQGKNVFFSPIAVSGILATLCVGAREETYQQIFNVLGFNNFQLSQSDVDEAFCRIVKSEQAQDIISVTAVLVENQFEPQPEFLDVLKKFSFVKVFSVVDFTKALDSVDAINKYVKDKTNGRINKLVDGLNSSIALYLSNYIYYKGKWPIGFDPALTMSDEFNVDENNKVPVQMMKIEKHFYTFDEEISTFVLHLPFSNFFSMLLLMPDNMTTLENMISPTHVTEWLNVTESRDCGIYIPKFSIKTSYTLNDVLKEMVTTDAFVHANLSAISKNEQRNLTSEVVHQAALDVDESGAAAATTGNVLFDSACLKPALKFNSPFILMIIERRSESILFMGKISNPNLKERGN